MFYFEIEWEGCEVGAAGSHVWCFLPWAEEVDLIGGEVELIG